MSSKLSWLWLSLLPARIKKTNSKNEGTRVVTTFFPLKDRTAYSAVRIPVCLKFEIMVVLVTCKNRKDPIKNEGAKMLTR